MLFKVERFDEAAMLDVAILQDELLAPIHNRMPVIINPADYSMWLDPGDNPLDALHLLRPYPPEGMQAYAVSTAVNNPRNESPVNIQPLNQA